MLKLTLRNTYPVKIFIANKQGNHRKYKYLEYLKLIIIK